jgi:hypothetical protein
MWRAPLALQVALYFAFLQLFTQALVWPALLGLVTTIYQLAEGGGAEGAPHASLACAIFVWLAI